ncbi:MAG: lysophospholipid acyltransferase family protein [Pseudomonadota bacterium]
MATWDEATPPELPPLRLSEKLRGTLRLGIFILMTAVALALFVLGRWLRDRFGGRVHFHFAIARLWSRAGLALMGVRHRVIGTPIAAGALVANHSSWADIFALRACRLMYFVSKAEVQDWPGVGFITKVTGTIFIERRRAHAKRQEEMLRNRITADELLIFFPEGTSTDGLRVLPFKSSLFSVFFLEDHRGADLWVQPVTLRYRAEMGLPEAFFGWWGTMPFEGHIWDVFARNRRSAVEVIFHDPVRPSDFADRKALAEHCQAAVARGLSGDGGVGLGRDGAALAPLGGSADTADRRRSAG